LHNDEQISRPENFLIFPSKIPSKGVAGKQGFESRFHDPESCVLKNSSPCATGVTKNAENYWPSSQPASSWHPQPQRYQGQYPSRESKINPTLL